MESHDLTYSSSDEKIDMEKGRVPVAVEHDNTAMVPEFEDPNLDKDAIVFEDDSPYPEVRSAVSNTDDPSMPASTVRSWCIGIFFAIIMAGLNQFFFFRYPSVTIGNLVAQLLSFPLGRLWARVVPNVSIFGLHLNPGPFTVKEHVLITIMATVATQSAYATDIVAVQRVYYGQVWNFSYQWLVVMSTQLIGISMCGVAHRFLVAPPSMIWPNDLVYCALFSTLHHQHYSGMGNRGGISRERFFLYAFICSCCWYFFPGYIFQALSYFSWVCWIAPNNAVVNQLFGYESGLGMSLLTFDWSQIAYIGSPLATPWWAEANVAVGFVLFFWVLAPAIYYTNTWYTQYMPMSSRTSYDNTGAAYNITRILDANSNLDVAAYKAYSPLFLSATFALCYGLSFASITSTLMHTILYFRKQIWTQARRSMNEQPDIHARLMSRYRQVPQWWYMVLFLAMFVFGIIAIEVWPTQMPVWAFVLSLLVAMVYLVPIGMIQAITNQQVGLNVITELIIGYALPGRPIAMMMFKTWGYITVYQALQYSQDLKLGHYMKVPPRALFLGQVIASMFSGTTQLGVQAWMFSNIKDMCSTDQPDKFICPNTEVFGTASFIWGVIGPQRQFSQGQIYYGLVFFFLIGAVTPIMSYVLMKRFPNSLMKYVNFPVIFTGIAWIPPATAINYVPWTIVGFIFQYVIRRRNFNWWAKYNYVLSAALDSGVAIGIVLVFFCLQYPANGTIGANNILTWWGNTVFTNTGDANGITLKTVPDGKTFGPATW